MPLNFWKDNADDGTDTNASIQPVSNGDPVEESYLNRAAQNLRKRTEDIRVLLDDLQAISRSDRAFALLAKEDTKIILDEPTSGSGEYRISINSTGNAGNYDRDIVLMPMLSPSKVAAPGPVPARFYYAEDASNGISLTMKDVSGHPRKVSEGSHNIYWQIIKDSNVTSTPIVEIKANDPANPDPEAGPVYIIVKIKADDTSTLSEIADAIDGSAVNTLVASSVNGSAAVTLGGSNSWGPYRAYETDENASVTGFGAQAGVDDEGFVITASAFNDFFVTNARKLKEGDTLFLDLANAKTRMQTTTASIFNDASSLHIISSDERLGTDTRNLGDADGPIPLFKVATPRNASSPMLYCINQKAFALGTSGYLLNSTTETDNIRSELADNSGTPYGDYMVGAEAKTNGNLTIAQGTVNSQIKDIAKLGDAASVGNGSNLIGQYQIGQVDTDTGISSVLASSSLRNHISTVNDRYIGTTGADSIGTNDKTGTGVGKTLGGISTKRRVGPQLQELLDYYDNHINNATPVDRHSLGSISGRPFITVSPATEEGDFQTIDAAVDALRTTGGLILVKQGTYSNTYVSGANIQKSIHIIAEPGTVFSGNVTNPVMQNTLDSKAYLILENVTFDGNAADSVLEFSSTGSERGAILHNCTIKRSVTSSESLILVNQGEFAFQNCEFEDFDRSSNAPAIGVDTGGDLRLGLNMCRFNACAQVLNASTATVRSFSMRDCDIAECVYTSGASNIGTQIVCSDVDTVDICNNRIYWTGVDSQYRALFCKITGTNSTGQIRGNSYTGGILTTSISMVNPYVIYINSNVTIENNYIEPGTAPAIHSTGAVLNNKVIDGTLNTTAPSYYVHVGQGGSQNIQVSGNFLSLGVSPVNADSVLNVEGVASVTGNTLDFSSAIYGITLIEPGESCVSNNRIDGGSIAGSTGIYCAVPAVGTRIVNNDLINIHTGIKITGGVQSDWIIANNHIINAPTNEDTIGISIIRGIRPLITNNQIQCATRSGSGPDTYSKGIYVEDAEAPKILNNTIKDAADYGIELYITDSTNRKFNVSNNYVSLFGDATNHGADGTPGGIYVHTGGGGTGLWGGVLNGNFIYMEGDTSSNSSFGIDISNAGGIACVGNYADAFSYTYYGTAFSYATNNQGLGQTTYPSNVGTYNQWIAP